MNSDEDRHKYVYEKYSESKADQIPDHSLFFDIFKDTLSKEFKEKLFPENYALSRQLNALDFKEAEIRRVNKHNQRLFIATSFAGQLEKDFNASHTREPLSKQLADQKALVVNLGKRADGFRDKSHTEWTESELNLLVDERIAKDKLESLTFYDEHNGDGFKNKTAGYAQRVFVYHSLSSTIYHFGNGKNARGKNSGNGLPSLVAKLSNILFPKDRMLQSRDVSTIHNRAKKVIAPANIERFKSSI
jgi:hypothetical protein